VKLLSALLVIACAPSHRLAGGKDIDVPEISAAFQAPPASKNSPNNRIGDFISGPDKPLVVDDESKRKLEELAKAYRKVGVDNYPLIVRTLRLEDKPAPAKRAGRR